MTKWSIDSVSKEAKKFSCKKEFAQKSHGAFKYAKRKNILEDICSHMTPIRSPNGYWTEQRLIECAKSCKNYLEFRENHSSAYSAALRYGLIDIVKQILPPVSHNRKKIQDSEIISAMESCVSIQEFRSNFPKLYSAASRRGMLTNAKLKRKKRPNGYWTEQRCIEVSKTCVYIKDFRNNFPSAYSTTLKRGWQESVLSHLLPSGSPYMRYVYVIINDIHKEVYVGLSVNPHKRFQHHSCYGTLRKFTQEPELRIVSSLIPASEAQITEKHLVDHYRKIGYKVLNSAKAGALGYVKVRWTYHALAAEALKYQSRSEFQKGSNGAYQTACKKGIMNDICGHMRRKPVVNKC